MPRFYFDIDDSGWHSRDDEGFALADVEAARDEAIGVLRDIAQDVLPDRDRWDLVSTVRDETGRVVFRAILSLVAERLDDKPR